MPPLEVRLTKVDDLIRGDHSHIRATDECFFLREYTSRAGFAHSQTNDLISNFKKPVSKRGTPEWRYKDRAVEQIARELRNAMNPDFLRAATLVPMPPSKAQSDPEYDDRMVRVLQLLASGITRDIRALLVQRASTAAHHGTGERRDIGAIQANYSIDDRLRLPPPATIAIFDDVLTTGAHFRAASAVLLATFPEVRVVGVFVARRVFPEGERPAE